MRRLGVPLLAVASVAAAMLAMPAQAADPPSGTIAPGGQLTWQGQFFAGGANTSNFAGDQLCSPSYPGGPDDPAAVPGVHTCDVFEFTIDVPAGYWANRNGGVNIDIKWESSDNDFDMYVFRRPPPGEPVGPAIASSAAGGTNSEHTQLVRPEGTFLVRVNPFAVVGSDYTGTITFFERDPIPRVRGGLEQVRASSTGYLSYSEPHIAVDPLDPSHLVAGSKMYQNLPEYLFKIGTFVSFDGGRSWTDNGHLPGYPTQTGNEGDDYYITSDVWTAFDDEGNAYAMVLDTHDANESITGAGWGMTLHRSTDGGRAWSGRIPIHENDDPVSKQLFLDDKNTLEVDNTGPDRDGKTGNMYACWSFDAPVANLAVFVGRSTDAGETWSDPVNVSGLDRTVIGCHVVVGPPTVPGGPGVLYVFWNNFGTDEMRMAKSADGGVTFTPPTTVVSYRPSPSPFPGSAFRNLSIPAGGVDPKTGTVYLSYADYHATMEDAACPPDEDAPEGQVCDSDVLIVESTDGGAKWSGPIRVNQDAVGNGKDQFQQQLAITRSGQLNIMWFDRRNDPQNFYIDTFFARSNDGGEMWKETRVTKSMWDPSINPPISPSGEFIGDYQGLAATECGSVPFWNDTTLANLSPTDPNYSPYQEAFSARIPNTPKFGGTGRPASCRTW
jgi:hypothetical protein